MNPILSMFLGICVGFVIAGAIGNYELNERRKEYSRLSNQLDSSIKVSETWKDNWERTYKCAQQLEETCKAQGEIIREQMELLKNR